MTDINTALLKNIEIETTTPIKKSVIWLHGLGADGTDFVPIVPELSLPAHMGIRFIFPHAPTMPVTINNGYIMPAWFDIYEVSIASKIDETGIYKSVKSVEALIKKEEDRGVDSKDIILAGFSQGGVIALTAGLCYPKPLGGIIALSTYLPVAKKIIQEKSPVNDHIPIFIAHGTEDTIVPYALGKTTYVSLKQAGYLIEWRSYSMPHSVCPEEIKDISLWLHERLKNS